MSILPLNKYLGSLRSALIFALVMLSTLAAGYLFAFAVVIGQIKFRILRKPTRVDAGFSAEDNSQKRSTINRCTASELYPVQRPTAYRSSLPHVGAGLFASPHEITIDEYAAYTEATTSDKRAVLKQTAVTKRLPHKSATLMNFPISHDDPKS